MKTALVTGIGGQDGVLLARSLLDDGYRVIGTAADALAARRVCDVYVPQAEVHEFDIRDRGGLATLLAAERPDEIYNLASASSVSQSWLHPTSVTEVNGLAVLWLLEELRTLTLKEEYAPRVLQASSSEMFGLADDLPQHEKSAHHPRSPYATAKSFAHHTAVNFRESYGINVSTAILFNHESPLRPRKFVTRKITSAVAAIALGLQETVTLGNLEVRRDWGAAVDYVEAMRLAIEAEPADDYCIATGVSHSLAELIEVAFAAADLPQGMDRVARDSTLERPADVKETLGDPSKAESRLGWSPRWSFEETVAEMVRVDIERIRTGVEHDVAYLARRSRLGSSA